MSKTGIVARIARSVGELPAEQWDALAGDAAAPKRSGLGSALRTLRFVADQVWLLLRSRWHRLGYACVNFGTPVSVREWAAARGIDFDHLPREQRQAEVAEIGRAHV